ncbi:hypothetical protein SESBI_16725 [Sesbania bispinosa]|nr:hypothetical protein SESBI_16725 [Sesbania bispinosa]
METYDASPRQGVHPWPCRRVVTAPRGGCVEVVMELPVVADEGVSMSGVDGEVVSPHGVDETDVCGGARGCGD